MGHRAIDRHPVVTPRLHRRGSREAADIAGTRCQQPRLGAMGAAQPEIDQQLAGCGQRHARRLGRNQRLEVQDVDQPGLDILRLRQGRGHPKDWLVSEEDRTLGHRMDIAGEAEIRQIVDQALPETPAAPHPVEVVWGNAQVFQEIEGLFEPSGDQKATALRQLADKEFEHRSRCLAFLHIRLHHRQLIKVGQQELVARRCSERAHFPFSRRIQFHTYKAQHQNILGWRSDRLHALGQTAAFLGHLSRCRGVRRPEPAPGLPHIAQVWSRNPWKG